MSEVQHETVYFSGHVQGIGFRHAALQVAREFDVSGYVANLADGRVQLEAEGAADQVQAFVAAIEERMHGYIRKVERQAARRAPRYRGFCIQ